MKSVWIDRYSDDIEVEVEIKMIETEREVAETYGDERDGGVWALFLWRIPSEVSRKPRVTVRAGPGPLCKGKAFCGSPHPITKKQTMLASLKCGGSRGECGPMCGLTQNGAAQGAET